MGNWPNPLHSDMALNIHGIIMMNDEWFLSGGFLRFAAPWYLEINKIDFKTTLIGLKSKSVL